MSDENDGEDGSTESGEETSEERDPGGGEEPERAGGGREGVEEQASQASSAGSNEPSGPQRLLDAVGEQIDEVRRRVDDQDTSRAEQEKFIEEGDADEGEPVDDNIAPPG